MPDERNTQNQRIVQALKKAGSRGLTSLDLSHFSLSHTRRVHELRKAGWTIKGERQEAGYFRYRIGAQDL